MTRQQLKVAVIGAGVSGLVTARELQREGQEVVVYEKSDQIGGIWVYNPKVEADQLGLDPNRKIVHSSLYDSLRANLPPELMEFTDYPFTSGENGKQLCFPGHEEVLKFLNNFVKEFGIKELIRFNNEVVRVEQKIDQWVVEVKLSNGELVSEEEVFDAVVVCNGHSTKPNLANLPGIEKWPGKQIHSHSYRVPEPCRDQVVVVIGFGPSALDISLDIVKVAKEVHISSRFPQIKAGKIETFDNLWQHLEVDYCFENGEIAFKNGALVAADIILHCTGYKFDFPFLKTNGIVTVDDNRVGPLYKHVFPPQLAPSLSFVGIPKRTVNFRMIELQAKWVAHVLSGKVILPSSENMLEDVEEHYRLMDVTGVPKHHTHTLPLETFIYLDWLAAQVGLPPADAQLKGLHASMLQIVFTSWFAYREQFIQSWPHYY
ncbi:hypothetical protein ACH5RR_000361 [Cinchona calisaya]|uniref:Flavin-containing monooxygenase n=1 Tax=Cinchona calisaya TaxID=153742 RepID=A0ABD3B0D9_9GENT